MIRGYPAKRVLSANAYEWRVGPFLAGYPRILCRILIIYDLCPISMLVWLIPFNTLRPRQNGRHFSDDTFKRIFLNENV